MNAGNKKQIEAAEEALKAEQEEERAAARGKMEIDDEEYEYLKRRQARYQGYKEAGRMPGQVAKLPALDRIIEVIEEYRAKGEKCIPLSEWEKYENEVEE